MRLNKIRKSLLWINIALAALFAAVVFSYARMCLNDDISKKIFERKPLKFSILIYGTEKLYPERLEAFLVSYERKTNLLKVISINTDMVVFDKKMIAKSLKRSFFETAKKDVNLAAANCYTSMFGLVDNTFKSDFYLCVDYETFFKMFASDNEMKPLIMKSNFANRDLECLNQLEIFERAVKSLNNDAWSNITRFRKYSALVNSNLSKAARFNFIMHFRFNNNTVMFADLPAKYSKRVEPDKLNISKFLSFVYYREYKNDSAKNAAINSQEGHHYDTKLNPYNASGSIEIKNASGKPRMAEKAAWLLRDKKFDVLEWSNSNLIYEKTLIKDYKGDFAKALKMSEILRAGKIIISYNSQTFYSTCVFAGQDCEIYDKYDKKTVAAKV
ncbi:MAG: LytR C-terminal domain-containing protein [Endomicrobium sp.]|nr:LytR C-terminal domain-containing protein [Endomicrobium sp.]